MACHVELKPLLGVDGEIDIIGGPLRLRDQSAFLSKVSELQKQTPEWTPENITRVAIQHAVEEQAVEWPPCLDRIVAVEAKACYVKGPQPATATSDFGSAKMAQMKEITKQLRRDEELGFDGVTLVDLIALPPQGGMGFDAWIAAAFHAAEAVKNSTDITGSRLDPTDATTGHWVMAFGAVSHSPESWAGAPQKKQLKPQRTNPRLADADVQENRRRTNSALTEWLREKPPRSFLHLILDADDRSGGL